MLALLIAAVHAAPPAPAPRSGIVRAMVPGDLLCYVTLEVNGKRTDVGATFELCERSKTFTGKRVTITYRTLPVADCQSAEPCGRTRRIPVATAMRIAP